MTAAWFHSEHSLSVLSSLRKYAGTSGRVRTSSITARLVDRLKITRIDVDEALRDLFRAKLITYTPNERELPASGFITVSQEAPLEDPMRAAWVSALGGGAFSAEEIAAIEPLSDQLSDLGPDDLQTMAQVIAQLRDAAADDDAGFNVSARYLMGGSKVLSHMTKSMLQALRLAVRLHNSSPKYVVCAGPPTPTGTLLIENPRAFENAVRSGLAQSMALVCTFGFGLSYLGQDWLHREDTPEADKPIVIVRSGCPPTLDELVKSPNVFLWADLDKAAVAIFQALKRSIPQLQFSMIYSAMLPMLEETARSHPYARIFEKDRQSVGRLGAELAVDLSGQELAIWLACQQRAVDQEAVDEDTILALGPLPMPRLVKHPEMKSQN